MKKWHLFAIVTVLFASSFVVVNQRYDRFYRINGINNDNRAIIEEYLSTSDQEYLVENQIPINHLISYMHYDGFNIRNHKYYEMLIKDGSYKGKNLIRVANSLKTKVEENFTANTESTAKTLLSNGLVDAYLKDKQFNFNYLEEYKALRSIYSEDNFVEDVESYVTLLKERGLSDNTIVDFFKEAGESYSESSLRALMEKADDKDIHLVTNPSDLTVTVSDKDYIGTFTPKKLTLMYEVHRVKYAMYLESEAYTALREMYKAMGNLSNTLVIREAYTSFEEMKNTDAKKAGFNEMQLGKTVAFTKSNLAYEAFEQSDESAWLKDNSYKYGYILRYDHDKASSTNHTYDAHYYRYVGKKAAKAIYENRMSLEEYNRSLKKR